MSPLEPQQVLDGLRGLRLRGPFVYKDLTGSTNDEAREAALAGAPEGAIFIAEEQRHGRGRQGRQWTATRGKSLLFSLILRPRCEPGLYPLLGNLAAVAVAEACEQVAGCAAHTKWPNDVLADGRKVAGILVEARAPDFAVVGIGVNVLQDAQSFPPELSRVAGSVAMAAGEAPNREALLAAVLNRLDDGYELLQSGRAQVLVERQRRLELTLGRQIVAEVAGQQVTGVATDLAPDGSLVIATDAGERVIRSGEVARICGFYGD